MNFILDTCVISELIKPHPNESVIAWLQSKSEDCLFLSVLSFGEIAKGIEKLSDETKKMRLKQWVEEDLKLRFKDRIISIDLDISVKWGEVQGIAELKGRPMPSIDGLIAASGIVKNYTVATRNISDMEQSSVKLLNPWEPKIHS